VSLMLSVMFGVGVFFGESVFSMLEVMLFFGVVFCSILVKFFAEFRQFFIG
jgi:hypothetical protein